VPAISGFFGISGGGSGDREGGRQRPTPDRINAIRIVAMPRTNDVRARRAAAGECPGVMKRGRRQSVGREN